MSISGIDSGSSPIPCTSSTEVENGFGEIQDTGLERDYDAILAVINHSGQALNQGIVSLLKKILQDADHTRSEVSELKKEVAILKREKLELEMIVKGKAVSVSDHEGMFENEKPSVQGPTPCVSKPDSIGNHSHNLIVNQPAQVLTEASASWALEGLEAASATPDNDSVQHWLDGTDRAHLGDNSTGQGSRAAMTGETDTSVKKAGYPPPAPRPPQEHLESIFQMDPRPCFNHYLSSHGCHFKHCVRAHEPPLSLPLIEALRFMAQGIRCKNGIQCTREDCHRGHQCQSTGVCRGRGGGLTAGLCPFLAEEHPEWKLQWQPATSSSSLQNVETGSQQNLEPGSLQHVEKDPIEVKGLNDREATVVTSTAPMETGASLISVLESADGDLIELEPSEVVTIHDTKPAAVLSLHFVDLIDLNATIV